MSKNYLITIILVTYNAEKHIEGVLESLIPRINEQTEVVVVDGLSTDNTVNIINNYDKYISKFISEKDTGIYDAMNKGVALSSGKFILFLGADDKLAINLKELVETLVDNNTIYYGDVILSPSNKIYGGKYTTETLLNRNICHQSIFYPRIVFDHFQFGNNYKYMEDYAMNLKLWCSKAFAFSYISKTVSIYNIEGLSSLNLDSSFQKNSWKIIYKNFGLYGLLVKCFNPLRNFLNF